MKLEWIDINQKQPKVDERVIYYFEYTGANIGNYFGWDENYGGHIFGGARGYLTGDVTHWMPMIDDPIIEDNIDD